MDGCVEKPCKWKCFFEAKLETIEIGRYYIEYVLARCVIVVSLCLSWGGKFPIAVHNECEEKVLGGGEKGVVSLQPAKPQECVTVIGSSDRCAE